jgi:hypothetical protein
MTYVVFIEKTIDPAIFLIKGDEQWDRVACLVGDGLKFLD